jgi:hypothetical protein
MRGEGPASNPFPGPRPFEESEKDRFFGREREVDRIVSLVYSQQLVLLYAQSGAGKTSLWNAGVAPQLRGSGADVLPVARVGGPVPQGVTDEAIDYVQRALLVLQPDSDPALVRTAKLTDLLAGRPRGDDVALRVLAFDQFEELFQLHSEQSLEQQRDFFVQLSEAADADRLLRAVLLLREDYLAQLDPFASLAPARFRARFRLERLDEDAALRAVVEPMERAGRRFEAGVAEELVRDLRTVSARGGRTIPGRYVEPVQLQAVCESLWSKLPAGHEVIRPADLEHYGNVDDALGELYEMSVREATAIKGVDEGFVRTWFERRLITPLKTRGMALQGDRATEGLPNGAVTVLENRHLIRAVDRAGASWYELSHDRFIEPVLQSNKVWRGDTRNELALAARDWEREGRDRNALLRGERLRRIAAWARTHSGDLDELEQDFLRLSQAASFGAQVRVIVAALIPIAPLVLSSVAIYMLWPSVEAATTTGANAAALAGTSWTPTDEIALLLWVAAFGAFGGSLQTIGALTRYVRDARVNVTLLWSSTLHAFVGIALAVLLWVVLLALLFGGEPPIDDLNRFGIAALAGLLGVFAVQVTDKLKDVLDGLFNGSGRP